MFWIAPSEKDTDDDAHDATGRFDFVLADPTRQNFAQREAVETVIWLYEVRRARDKYDRLRFDASGAVSGGRFPEDWPRYVLKMTTGAGKTKVLSLLIAWSFFHKLYDAFKAAINTLTVQETGTSRIEVRIRLKEMRRFRTDYRL